MGEFVTCRRVIYTMLFFGFIVHNTLKANLSIAIVEMTKKSNDTVESEPSKWTLSQRNDLIGSIVWGFIVGEVPGGRLSEKIGPRKTFGRYILLSSFVTLLFPTACALSYYLAWFTQFLLGFLLGGTISSSSPLAVNWLSAKGRNHYASIISTISIGVACSMAISGLLIPKFGWQSAFYTTGSLGILYACFWFYLIYDTPEEHPRISKDEKERIKMYASCSTQILADKRKSLPWSEILTSRALWAIIVAQCTANFGYFILLSQTPTYFNNILKFDIRENGLLSSLPFLGNCLVALTCATLSNIMLKSEKLSKKNVRRFFGVGGYLCCGISIALLPVFGYSKILSVTIFVITGSLMGTVFLGHVACIFDIAPTFIATTLSLVTFFGMPAEWIATKCVTLLLKDDVNSFTNWCNIFWLMSGVYIIGGLIFGIFCSTDAQPWN